MKMLSNSTSAVEENVRAFCMRAAKNVPVVLMLASAEGGSEAQASESTPSCSTAALTEEFLRYGFGVVLMQNEGCKLPFASQLPASEAQWLAALQVQGQGQKVLLQCPDSVQQDKLLSDLRARDMYDRKGSLLLLPFSAEQASAGQHLALLQAAAQAMHAVLSERNRMLVYVLPGSWEVSSSGHGSGAHRRSTLLHMEGGLNVPAADDDIVAKDSGTDSDSEDEEEDADAMGVAGLASQAAMLHMENMCQKWAPSASIEGLGLPGVDEVVQRYLAALVKSEQFHVHATVNQFRNQALAGVHAGTGEGYQGREAQQPMQEGDEGDAKMTVNATKKTTTEPVPAPVQTEVEKAAVDWAMVVAALAVGAVVGMVGGRMTAR